MNTHDIELPPLPEGMILEGIWVVTEDELIAYRDACINAAIEADRKRRGEPVASIYITESGEREFDDWRVPLPAGRTELFAAPQPTEPCDHSYHYFGDYPIRRCNKCKKLEQQPAEPVKVPSDDELKALAMSVKAPGPDGFILRYARALLARYGSTTGEATKQQR